MASKLNPGADSTLVNVAYRAAMADTPADYSKTFENMADSYEKTMQASSDMWGNVAKVGAAIGGEMMKNAQELTDMVAKGATLNPTDAEMFTNEIYGIKDELSSLGMFSGQFGDRETRLKRAELKIKQQELFADIDNAVANLKVGADAVAAGTFDANLAMGDGEMVNAIIKSNLKNNVTDNKNIARLSRDEDTGELMYTLYNVENNPDGEVLMGDDDKPRTMTIKQFNESIATNVKDGGAMMKSFVDLREAEANAGNKALNGTYDPERKQMTLNNLDLLLGDKPVNLKRAMRTPVGYSNTSLYDDLTSKSVLSAELYGALNKVSGNENGELTGGVVDGIEDVDGSGGISASEINYDVLVGNITGLKDAEVSKEFFKQYAVKQMEAAYEYGYSKKPIVPGSGPDGSGFSLLKGSGKSEIGADDGNGYIPNSALNTIGKKAHNRDDINIGANNFIWDKEEKVYKIKGVEVPNKLALFDAIYGGGFDPKNILSMYNSIEDWQGDTRLEGTFDEKSGLSISDLEQDDNLVATKLNESIAKVRTEQNPEGYHFDITKNIFGVGDFVNDAVVLLDKNNDPVEFPEGHEFAGQQASFYVDQDNEGDKQASFDYLIEILEHFNLKTEKKELTAADYAAGK